ncbi:transposase [Streptomyces sp. NBC_00233]|uniref:transposase n=1 Tax=Streptomyces sp. NBC_00233 TaxID=2975686 RepID=UPI002257A71B|nr:transposase [Streptomyces sp. NBC_00233]MCX5233363.1 transposase [Streptomyces sp. NBC_00233]
MIMKHRELHDRGPCLHHFTHLLADALTGRSTALDRAARRRDDARLAARIRVVHFGSDGTYGVPRITTELHAADEHVNHKRIARIVRNMNLEGLRLRRRHRTTIRTRPR